VSQTIIVVVGRGAAVRKSNHPNLAPELEAVMRGMHG